MNTPTYTQSIKNDARRFVLERAVKALTADRSSSVVVSADEFDDARNYAITFLEQYNLAPSSLRSELLEQSAEWHTFHRSVVGHKEPSDLRVLYLCGPEPENDLSVLLELGIVPQNVWAVESVASIYQEAVQQLKRKNRFIRIHHGGLDTFFDSTNERFDIIYIDACGPLLGGHPNTIRPPLLLFHRERLAPLGVLITNFAQPPTEKMSEYERLMCYYFAPRYNDCPRAVVRAGADPAVAFLDPGHLLPYIRSHFDDAYSDFVTRLLVDLGRDIIPVSRIYDNKDLRAKYFAPAAQLKEALQAATSEPPDPLETETPDEYLRRYFMQTGDVLLNASGYPLLQFLRNSSKDKVAAELIRPILDYKLRNEPIEKSLLAATVLAKIAEGHAGVASLEMQAALRQSWVDSAGGLFCDVPLPNLLINTLYGIYGHPYLPNPRRSTRISYTAKTTKMYMDVLVLDQCRYFYDYLPTIDLIPDRFRSVAYQLVLRACLDRMGRYDFSSSSHPFHGAALGGFGEYTSASAYDFSRRRGQPPWAGQGPESDDDESADGSGPDGA
ncbi:MAG: class I SAM-dependent methyltransferase [Polyangiales bacterium]